MFSIRNDFPPVLRAGWLVWIAIGVLLVAGSAWALSYAAANRPARGLQARVYRGVDFAGASTLIARDQANDPGQAARQAGLDPRQPFSIEWDGVAVATEDGVHHIRVRVDDGVSVWIDDRLLVERLAPGRHELSASMPLSRGFHRLRVRYVQLGGEELFRLSWARPSWREHFVAVFAVPPGTEGVFRRVAKALTLPTFVAAAWSVWLLSGLALAFCTACAAMVRANVAGPPRSGMALTVVALLVLGFGVHVGAAPWRGWVADEVLPADFLPAAQEWFVNGWAPYYPPLHLYLSSFVASPFLWLAYGSWLDLAEYDTQTVVHVIGRLVSVVMAALTLLIVAIMAGMTIGKRLSFLAPFFLLTGPPFVFYSKTMNLDIPYVFWVSLAVLFFLRALTTRSLFDHVLLGAVVALAVATKDQAYGFFIVAALSLGVASWSDTSSLPSSTARALATLRDVRLWAGATTCLLVYILVLGVLWNRDGVIEHFALITGRGSQHFRMFAPTVQGMGELTMATVRLLPPALGPVCAVFAAVGLGVALLRPRRYRLLLLLLLLAVGYLVSFVAVVGYVYDRFLLGVALPAALLAAVGFDTALRAIPAPRARRALAVGLLMLAIWPAMRLNWRITSDSRLAVEKWMSAATFDDPLVVGSGLPVYLPNLHPYRHVVDTRPGVEALVEWDADAIVLNEEWLARTGETMATASPRLEAAGYRRVFTAGREARGAEPFSNVEKIDPPLSVWRRTP
jgi:4-amino-4-deoxy-L-arabinose transferase-like glycosyltransferase